MRNDKHGIALVAALSVILVVALLVLGAAFTTQIQNWTTRNDATSTEAYYAAHGGLEIAKAAAFQSFRYYLAHLSEYSAAANAMPTCGNLLSFGLDLNRDGTIDASQGDVKPGGVLVGSNASGTYSVTYRVDGKNIVLTSVGKAHGAQATVQQVIQAKNAGIFSNAIFAGNGGQATKFINGGANIYGSVYIEGNAPTTTVINSNGNFGMHNYYTPSTLGGLVNMTSSQLSAMLNNTAVDQTDLCATLRVAAGKIDVGGSTSLGDPPPSTQGYKGSLAGIYVQNGTTTGTSPDITNNASIWADNYPNGNLAYDLGQTLNLPSLDANLCNSSPGTTWRDCMQNSPTTAVFTPGAIPSGLTGTDASTCANELANINSAGTLTFGTTDVTCTWTDSSNKEHGFSYTFDSSTNNGTLTVHDLVDFKGFNLYFQKNVATHFSGKATIMADTSGGAGGNITIDGDVLPTSDFPKNDVLGMIASNDLTFTGATQSAFSSKQLAVGLFYAGNQATVAKGGVVMGSVLANSFCTTSNCNAGQTATVVQVPGLEYNLAPGFTEIPNATYGAFYQYSYERR